MYYGFWPLLNSWWWNHLEAWSHYLFIYSWITKAIPKPILKNLPRDPSQNRLKSFLEIPYGPKRRNPKFQLNISKRLGVRASQSSDATPLLDILGLFVSFCSVFEGPYFLLELNQEAENRLPGYFCPSLSVSVARNCLYVFIWELWPPKILILFWCQVISFNVSGVHGMDSINVYGLQIWYAIYTYL